MVKKIKAFRTICLPHLDYTVYVKDLSELKLINESGVEEQIATGGYTTKIDHSSCAIFFEDIKNSSKNIVAIPYLAHEVMHVIQLLCERSQMKVEEEKEHTAYLMHYILNQIIND